MHTVRASYKTSFDNDDVSGGTTHELLRCNGCFAGTYRTESWFSEDDGITTSLYPPRGIKRAPRQWRELPYDTNLEQVYDQTLSAFNAGLLTLAGAGVRLVIEGVCLHQKVEDGPKLDAAGSPLNRKDGSPIRSDTLEGKINGLAEQGFISPKQATYLHEIRFLGNDAAHQLDIPTGKVVGHALDIVEHMLDQVYEQPAKALESTARIWPKE